VIAEWSAGALADWHRLTLEDAHAVAVAVQRWIDSNEGFVIAHTGAYHLLVDRFVVRFFVEDNVMRIVYVRRLR
jgi:hypothetical protein